MTVGTKIKLGFERQQHSRDDRTADRGEEVTLSHQNTQQEDDRQRNRGGCFRLLRSLEATEVRKNHDYEHSDPTDEQWR